MSIKLNNSSSNLFLKDFLDRFKWNQFYGIFSSDNIPVDICQMESFSIICNLSRKNEIGTHFVTIIKNKKIILYLDPLALYITLNNDIDNFIAKCKPDKICKLTKAIQHMNSWYCGYFNMFFLLFFNTTVSCKKLYCFNEKDLLLNDCICLNNLMLMYSEIL